MQRAGTQLVDIDYDLADADSPTLTVTVAVSTNGGASYTLPAVSFTGALGVGVTPGSNKRITWNAGTDWPNKFSANVRFTVTASDDTAPSGMALIPAGSTPVMNLFRAGNNVVVTWPTNSTGFTLEYKTNLTAVSWTTNAIAPVVVIGSYMVTNPISTGARFYRLKM